MSTCRHIDDVVAFVFHQLSPAEESQLKSHLASCTICRLKLTEMLDTVDHLGLAAPAAGPAPGLKAKVLSRVQAEMQNTPVAAKRRWVPPVWISAAAALALVVGTYSLMRVQGLQERLLGFQLAARVEQSIPLVGVAPDMPDAGARVVLVKEGAGTRITLEGQGLRPLSPGEVYQLWLVKDGKRTSGGVFVVDATGRGGTTTWLAGEVAFDTMGVSREPDAFGTQPRGPKVLGSV